MVENKLQFAVVREDPMVEAELLRQAGEDKNIFLIGSAGCTALTLKGQYPKATITLLDPNPVQINLVREKIEALKEPDDRLRKRAFGVGIDDPKTLTSSGNFESLFRRLRDFIYEFVCAREDWLKFFTGAELPFALEKTVFSSNYWPVAFKLFFSDPLLVAMFGKAAIQHAPPGSYPDYFRRVFEKGLKRNDAKTNYFLHHVFLGHYLDLPACTPLYLSLPTNTGKDFEFIEAFAQNGPNYSRFDVISLSVPLFC